MSMAVSKRNAGKRKSGLRRLQAQIEASSQEQTKNRLAAEQLEVEAYGGRTAIVGATRLSMRGNTRLPRNKKSPWLALSSGPRCCGSRWNRLCEASRNAINCWPKCVGSLQPAKYRSSSSTKLCASRRQTLAELSTSKQRHAEQFAVHAAADEGIRRERAALVDQLRSRREQLTALQAQQHKVEVTAARLRHERQTLAERMQDDYGIELETAEASRGARGGVDVGSGSCRAGNRSASRPDQQHRGDQSRGAR